MSFTPLCQSCGLGGESCRLRFSKSPKPKYKYEKRKTGLGIQDWCVAVHPAPRKIARPEKESCEAWRDPAGNDAEAVRKAIAAGEYAG